ncbi:MAG: hypothetical protein LBU84_12305 [Prevotella sp.]|jgi:hypothetical protein|nr:hypothetical protein [Prevotella sp.]
MNVDIHKITPSLWSVILTILVVTATGSLLIFVFDRELFLKLDTLKLILLSFGIIAPIFLTNVIICTFLVKKKISQSESNNQIQGLIISSFIFIGTISLIPMYGTILTAIFANMSIYQGIAFIGFMEVVGIGFAIFFSRKLK